jgi:hypothetical protein
MEGCRERCKADLVTKLLRLRHRVRLDGGLNMRRKKMNLCRFLIAPFDV